MLSAPFRRLFEASRPIPSLSPLLPQTFNLAVAGKGDQDFFFFPPNSGIPILHRRCFFSFSDLPEDLPALLPELGAEAAVDEDVGG